MQQEQTVKTQTKVSTKVIVGFAVGALLGAGAFSFVNMAQDDVIDEVIAQQQNPIKLDESEKSAFEGIYSEEEIETIMATWTEETPGFFVSPDDKQIYYTDAIADQVEVVGGDMLVYRHSAGVTVRYCYCPASCCCISSCTYNSLGCGGKCTAPDSYCSEHCKTGKTEVPIPQ